MQHILSFLSQNEAMQTSVLSKSWRYLGPTRPNVEFRLDANYYGCSKLSDYLPIIDQTLLRYQDQNLRVREFIVEMITLDPETISHVEKWILILVLGGVETLDLMFYVRDSTYFDLPSVVFEAKSLRKLCLLCCKLSRNSFDKVLFTHLHTLSLTKVYIDDEAFEKIMSTCIFIERVVLDRCPGLTNVRVGNSTGHHYYNLKHFDFTEGPRDVESYYDYHFPVERDVPTLETIKINGRWIRYDQDDQSNIYFPRLKSLSMFGVVLHRESFDIMLSNLPCLQDLSIEFCGGFKELRIVNPSIKHLTISSLEKCIRQVTIDAPNIEEFVYKGLIGCPLSFTTSREWKSSIHMWYGGNFNDDHSSSSWFLEIHELLEAVSQSEISLRLSQHTNWRFQYRSDDGHIEDIFDGLPVLVECLDLSLTGHSSASLVAFLMRVFGSCRPRNIRTFWIAKPQDESQLGGKLLTEFLCETLILKRGRGRRYSWLQDLEQASMEVFDQSCKKWRSVKGKRFLAYGAALFPNLEKVCFKLKWRQYK